MKNILFLIFLILLAIEAKRSIPRNLKEPETTGEGENPPEGGENPPGPPPEGGEGDNPPGPPPSGGGDNSYNYTDYKANVTDENVGSDELTATESDQSVVYITTNNITFTEPNLIKLSGESSNIENSEFYGVNAAVLVQGGEVSITGGTITTKAKGGNAICATNKGKVTISGTKIVSTAVSSGRGLHSTYGGQINAVNVDISSTGASCANLATDRGEGVVTCTGCQLSTTGAGSPLIYSTGQITVNNTKGTATGAQTVVVEGKNTANIFDKSELYCYGTGNRNNIDNCGVMIYQSMSGDAADGTGVLNCVDSTLEILKESEIYTTAPMFFVTNTKAVINLEDCRINYGSNIFLDIKGTTEWGNEGSNGGEVTLNLNNQEIKGDITVDGISSLSIVMKNSKITGTINTSKKAKSLSISLDSKSTITLTGNSYYTSLTNEVSSGENIVKGEYTFDEYGNDGGEDVKPVSKGSFIGLSMLLVLFVLF
jgi:hypothetical protein